MVKALRGWDAIDMLAEAVRDAAAGHGQILHSEVQRLRSWHQRWQLMDPVLRSFYVRHLDQISARVGLWHVLQGQPHRLHPVTEQQVQHLWKQETGQDPHLLLFPLLR